MGSIFFREYIVYMAGHAVLNEHSLHQAVVVPKQKKKQIRITGARVLTSEEAIKIMQDKEDEKRKRL